MAGSSSESEVGGSTPPVSTAHHPTPETSEPAVVLEDLRKTYGSGAARVEALPGIAPGLLIGYELARFFMQQFSYDWFSFEVDARGSTFVLSSVAILVVALLSQLPGLRAVKRLDVARVVRERSA